MGPRDEIEYYITELSTLLIKAKLLEQKMDPEAVIHHRSAMISARLHVQESLRNLSRGLSVLQAAKANS